MGKGLILSRDCLGTWGGVFRTLDVKVNELLGGRNMEVGGLAKGLAAARIGPESGNWGGCCCAS